MFFPVRFFRYRETMTTGNQGVGMPSIVTSYTLVAFWRSWVFTYARPLKAVA